MAHWNHLLFVHAIGDQAGSVEVKLFCPKCSRVWVLLEHGSFVDVAGLDRDWHVSMEDIGGDEHDVYVAQLREVFDSCDTTKAGKLNRAELLELCKRLQVEDQGENLVVQLLGSDPETDGRVGFEEFKEGFVAVLSQTVEGLESSFDEDDESHNIDEDIVDEGVSPKYVKGDKKYGRRSRPGTDTEDFSDAEFSYASPRTPRTKPLRDRMPSEDSMASYDESQDNNQGTELPAKGVVSSQRRGSGGQGNSTQGSPAKSSSSDKAETFEAEGQMNQAIADMENVLDPVSEELHLKDIWRELGVGKSGYLTLVELATVCSHIGMDEMDTEELQQLFDKLDVDKDGQVSFQEFLRGLFQHGPTGPPTPVRPISTPRQKLRFSVSQNQEDRNTTPSFVSSGSTLFSSLDPDNTGYAKPDDLIEMWDNMGIPQGVDILEYLQIDLHTKVNLGDLSYALEQELRSCEEDNATYQAAIASYQQELRHLKVFGDQATGERDKLKNDLHEANNRIAILVKEGDDRHASLERSKEKEMRELEQKYQEQIKSLQAQLDREQEQLLHQSSRQRTKLESEISKLKEEENKLKDKLSQTQKELEKLEKEILDMAERYAELERHSARQQKELDSAADLQRKLEEIESDRTQIRDEEQKFTQQKLETIEGENTDLKDKNDELTMEVEELKQQLAMTRRRGKTTRDKDPTAPSRQGSVLSDYAKPTIIRRSIDTSEENSEEDDTSGGRPRRRLPQRPTETSTSFEEDKPSEKSQAEISNLKKEQETMRAQHLEEVEALRRKHEEEMERLREGHDTELDRIKEGFELERKEIEQAFKMEVTEIEDQHNEDKERLLQTVKNEHEELKLALDRRHQEELEEALAQREEELTKKYEEEKRDLLIKAESEKNLMTQKYAEEKASIMDRMRQEFAEELMNKLQDQRERFSLELDERSSAGRSDVENLKEQMAEMELRMKLQQEEMELSFQKERTAMMEQFEADRTKLEEKYRLDILNYENMFTKGKGALKGKLEADFYALLEKHKEEVTVERIGNMDVALRKERQKLEEQFEAEKAELLQTFEKEKQDLEKSYEEEKDSLEKKYKEENESLERRYEEEKDGLKRRYEEEITALKEQLEDQLEDHVREKAELRQSMLRKYRDQVMDLEEALEEEREKNKTERAKITKEMRQDSDDKVAALERKLEEEREQLKEERARLEQRILHERTMMEQERERLEQSIIHERTMMEQERDSLREALEEELSQEIQARFEEESMEQIERLRQAFDDEREQYETRVCLLQDELNETQHQRHLDDSFRTRMESQSRELESKYKKQLDDLNRINTNLREDKHLADQKYEQLNQRYQLLLEENNVGRRELEDQIRRLTEQRETSIQSVSASSLQAGTGPERQTGSYTDREKVILDAISSQKYLLESRTTELKHQIQKLSSGSHNISSLQLTHDNLVEEKRSLERNLEHMQDKLQDLLDKSMAADQYKAQLDNWEEERTLLREQLHMAEDKIAEANTALTLAQAEHMREVQNLRERAGDMVDMTKYNNLNLKLVDSEKKVRELEMALEQRSTETTRMIVGTHQDHKRSVQQLEEERGELQRQLDRTQTLLDEHVDKFREQLSKTAHTDVLVKDLYVENSQLMQSLYLTEKREKEANSKVYKLEDKCKALQKVVKQITMAALA